MLKRVFSAVMLILLLANTLTLAFNIQSVKANGIIVILADGSIYPSDAPLSTVDAITYTFTGDIINDSIVVQRDNIVLDGAGFTVQGDGTGNGIDLSDRSNITIKNTNIRNFYYGIILYSSSDKNISGNNITANAYGIWLESSSGNSISGNNITANNEYGIYLYSSSGNSISENNITNDKDGVSLHSSSGNNISENNIVDSLHGILLYDSSSFNSISGNNITNNEYGISLYYFSSFNSIFHNNFINNVDQVYSDNSVNVWDNSYPSGGNYWSDYTGEDSNNDGIGDTPYVIDSQNQDNYPLMHPWTSATVSHANATKGGQVYDVQVMSNATVIDLREGPGSIKLKLSGQTGISGYVRIIAPIGLNSSDIKVFLNNTKLTFPSIDPPRSILTNLTHYFIYFVVEFHSSYEIVISYPVTGDLNYDGTVDILDAITLANAFLTRPTDPTPPWNPNADINDDTIVDILDAIILSNHFLEHYQ